MQRRGQRTCKVRQRECISTGEVVLHSAVDALGHGTVNRDCDGNDHRFMIFRVRQSPTTVFGGISANILTQADARNSYLISRRRDAGDRRGTALNNGPFVA